LDGAECEDLVSDGAGAGIFGRDYEDLFLLTPQSGCFSG
jgi:hypothetical protein